MQTNSFVQDGQSETDTSKLQREVDEYNFDIQRRLKMPDEIVLPIEFEVNGVSGRVCGPNGEIIINVSPNMRDDAENPVRAIRFNHILPIEKWDMIRAYIFAGEKKGERYLDGSSIAERAGRYLVQRQLRAEERAVRIEKISHGDVLAEYTDKDYFNDLTHELGIFMFSGFP